MARRKAAERVRLTLLVRERLRARIEKAARARDVSLNHEATERLEASFREGDILARIESTIRALKSEATP